MRVGEDAHIPEVVIEGRERLWGWFGLDRASFLTLPRVLMHEMPDEWQKKMAALLEEYDEVFNNQPNIGSKVFITDLNGRLIKTPSWLLNYRHPNKELIESFKRPVERKTD